MLGFEKVPFLHLPTPLEYLPALSKELGIKLYIKRDDLTNLGAGGNKLRKLEYFLYDAQNKGCTMLITVGGAQTNHGRLTAAVAAKFGMKCAIVGVDNYPGEVSANILLDRMMGAEVVLHKPDGTNLMDVVAEVTKRYESQGEKVYFIPLGGSNELGAMGYYECAKELAEQMPAPAKVVCTIGSMGTYMGLLAGLYKTQHSLTGVVIAPMYEDVHASALEYFYKFKEATGIDFNITRDDLDIKTDYTFGAYNNAVKDVRDAMYEMASKEAIILDPCYTGKTYAGLKDMVQSGEIKQGETVIFLHTGGMPGINTPHHRVEMEKELEDGVTILG